jgi:hypothetical protein
MGAQPHAHEQGRFRQGREVAAQVDHQRVCPRSVVLVRQDQVGEVPRRPRQGLDPEPIQAKHGHGPALPELRQRLVLEVLASADRIGHFDGVVVGELADLL